MADAKPVDPADRSRKTSDIVVSADDEATVSLSEMDRKCYWNDIEYEEGAMITAEGKFYTCSFGKWVPTV